MKKPEEEKEEEVLEPKKKLEVDDYVVLVQSVKSIIPGKAGGFLLMGYAGKVDELNEVEVVLSEFLSYVVSLGMTEEGHQVVVHSFDKVELEIDALGLRWSNISHWLLMSGDMAKNYSARYAQIAGKARIIVPEFGVGKGVLSPKNLRGKNRK